MVSKYRIKHARGAAHQIPSFLLDGSEISLVHDGPDSCAFALQTRVASTEGEAPDETLGHVGGGFDDRLDEVGEDPRNVMEGEELERAVEAEDVSSAGRVAEMLRRSRMHERSRRGKVGLEEIVIGSHPAYELSYPQGRYGSDKA